MGATTPSTREVHACTRTELPGRRHRIFNAVPGAGRSLPRPRSSGRERRRARGRAHAPRRECVSDVTDSMAMNTECHHGRVNRKAASSPSTTTGGGGRRPGRPGGRTARPLRCALGGAACTHSLRSRAACSPVGTVASSAQAPMRPVARGRMLDGGGVVLQG